MRFIFYSIFLIRYIKQYLLVTGFLFIQCIVFSQPDSTLFENELEKKVISSLYRSEKVDNLDLYLMCGLDSTISRNIISDRLTSFYSSIGNLHLENKSVEKRVKLLYKKVHSYFFEKYNEEKYFNDIFSGREYNCLSASALYTLIFSHYGIPFHIKEKPAHVYLIADPAKSKVIVETTNPKHGVYSFDDGFVNNYLKYLLDNKIISQKETENSSSSQLFDKYYYTDSTINITQLAGLQYYNKGVFSISKKNFKNALLNFEKSQILYPSLKINYLITNCLINMMSDEMQNKSYDGKILAKYINNNSDNSTGLLYAMDYFRSVSNELMINRPKINVYKQYFDDFSRRVEDSIQIEEYSYIYHSLCAYYYLTLNSPNESLVHCHFAYQINPENLTLKEMIVKNVYSLLSSEEKTDLTIDSVLILFDMFPFLYEMKGLNKIYYFALLNGLDTAIRKGNLNDGIIKIESVINIIQKKSITEGDEFIEKIYNEVASLYIRKRDYENAKKILRMGMEKFPDSELLKSTNRGNEYFINETKRNNTRNIVKFK